MIKRFVSYLFSSSSNNDSSSSSTMVSSAGAKIVGRKKIPEVLKLIIVGERWSGQSALVERFCDRSYAPKSYKTIGVDFHIERMITKNLEGEERTFKMQIWDPAPARERFRTLTNFYFRGARLGVLVVDLTKKDGIGESSHYVPAGMKEHVKRWVIVGTKCDDKDNRKISPEQLAAFAAEYGALFHIETSAKDNINVDELFIRCLHECIVQRDEDEEPFDASGEYVRVDRDGNVKSRETVKREEEEEVLVKSATKN